MKNFRQVVSILLLLFSGAGSAQRLTTQRFDPGLETTLNTLRDVSNEIRFNTNDRYQRSGTGLSTGAVGLSIGTTKCFNQSQTLTEMSYLTTCEEQRTEFQKQYDVCSCINNLNNDFLTPDTFKGFNNSSEDSLVKKDVLRTESYALAHLENIMNGFSQRSTYKHNMMILHAQGMGEDTAIKYGLNEPVEVDSAYIAFVKDNLKDNLKAGLGKHRDDAGFDQNIDNILSNSAVGRKDSHILNILSDGETDGESCLPMKDYLFFNSFPKDNSFWKNLPASYSQEDWDLSDLVGKYSRAKTDAERDLIGGRIEFLEKNPFIKLALDSDDKNVAEKVYKVISRQMAGLRCSNEKGACHKSFTLGKLNNYKNELTKVFQEPDMIEFVQKARAIDTKEQIADLLSGSFDKVNLNTLNTWAEKEYEVTMNDCQINFNYYNPGLYSASSTANLGVNGGFAISAGFNNKEANELIRLKCLESMPVYCREVGTHVGSILSQGRVGGFLGGDRGKLDDLYFRINNDLTADPKMNSSYLTDSREYCENHYRKHKGKSVNFEEFKASVCTRNPAEFCSDKGELLKAFFTLKEDKTKNTQDNFYGTSVDVIAALATNSSIANLKPEDRELFRASGGAGASVDMFFHPDNEFKNFEKSNIKENFVDASNSFGTMADDSVGAADSVYTANFQTSNTAFSSNFGQAYNSFREAKEEVDEEIKATKEAITHNKARLARSSTTPEFKSEVENRLKMLEDLLVEKEKSSQQYQDIISKLIEAQKKESVGSSVSRLADSSIEAGHSDEVGDEPHRVAATPVRSGVPTQVKNHETNEDLSRAPASISENFSTSGGTQGGAASMGGGSSLGSSSAASAVSRGAINSALLSKYGITVQDSDASVQVAVDKDRGQISQLLTNASSSDIGVEVSRVEYDKFKNYDLNALNQLYEDRIEMLESDVVKLMIHAKGVDESLEFYAIKEDGKVVFQPVRKTKLSDLQNALR